MAKEKRRKIAVWALTRRAASAHVAAGLRRARVGRRALANGRLLDWADGLEGQQTAAAVRRASVARWALRSSLAFLGGTSSVGAKWHRLGAATTA